MIRAAHLLMLAAGLTLAAALRDGVDDWVAATVLPPLVPETSVQVLDRDGDLLRAYTVADGRWRLALSVDGADPLFRQMLIAYEDGRFDDHAGVDPVAMARAMAQALWHGEVVSGGSTLTMQVARLLENNGTGRVSGKLRQMRVALALERRLTKDQILTLYLHLAPYGGNIEGLRAASLAYFGKEPRRLTPAEAALLVAIPQSPESRRPDRHPDAAADARDRVLARAVAKGLIDADQAAAARTEMVPVARRPVPALAPHLADRTRADDPAAQTHQLTIDATLQAALETLAAATVRDQGDRLQIAIAVADHASGEILASVGSAAFAADARQGFVDMTQALRSPGSTLKPLVYGLAFDEGLAHPETMMDDRPIRFGGYAPQNFDRQFHGTLRGARRLAAIAEYPGGRIDRGHGARAVAGGAGCGAGSTCHATRRAGVGDCAGRHWCDLARHGAALRRHRAGGRGLAFAVADERGQWRGRAHPVARGGVAGGRYPCRAGPAARRA